MKRHLLAVVALFVVAFSASAVAIVPQPLSITKHENNFTINTSTTICCEVEAFAPIAKYTQEYLKIGVAKVAPKSNYISLVLDKSLAEEEYRLSVSRESVRIVAGGYGGAFNGVQTLFQLLPSEVYTKQMKLPATVQGCEIADKPKFAYRGFLLDVARTFMAKDDVLRYIDYIAYHKINKLHWHLTDSQGWRIEIKSHPDLAKKGGFRGGDALLTAALGKWEEKYGGYYTQEEIREVVAYAAVRNIEIIPEIDLPGHSGALAAVYPQLLCKKADGTPLKRGGVVCATNEKNYALIEEILAEVCALFPSDHFHIGGDEVNMAQWKKCPDCSAWLAENGYTDGHKLEDMFMDRVQAILAKYGKVPSVWNEAAKGGGLSKEAWVHGWKSAKVCKEEVLMKGYRTIFMPQEFFYFDMRQSKHEEGAVWGGCFDVRKTYSFDFAKEGFTPAEIALVEGFEGAYWSETFLSHGGDKSLDFIEYQTFPRLCALSEQGWGKNGGGEWQEFHNRLYKSHYDRMADMGLNFRITPPNIVYKENKLSVETIDNSTIYYREENSSKAHRYTGAISTSCPGKYLFWAEYRGAKSPEVAHASHFATIKPKVTLTSSMPENPRFPFSNIARYSDNIRTKRTSRKGDWILFEFEEKVECRKVEFCGGTYAVPSRLITKGYLELSEDGKTFKRVGDLENGHITLINPRPFKAARIVSESDHDSVVAIPSPRIYPKWK